MKSEQTYASNSSIEALLGAWCETAIGLLDLDAFFASVEQLDHPEWRGRPVIVGGPPESRGVVSTASYEARCFGVHSAMSSAQAKRLCPEAIWTRGNFKRYRELSSLVMDIIADETPFVERVSIDEAFFDVTQGRFGEENPILVCKRISSRVSELGITCSIGLGTSKTIAKIASERDKPRGITVVPPGTEQTFLAPLPVRAMSGIGKSAERALARVGIYTLGQLSLADDSTLRPIFGVNTDSVRMRARGLENASVRAIDAIEQPKSVSNDRTFPHDLTDRIEIEAAISLLGESVGRRLRKADLLGSTVTLKIKYSYGSGRTAQRKMRHRTDDEHVFVPQAIELLDSIWSDGMSVRLIGIGMSDFDTSKAVQTDLFCDVDERGAQSSELRNLSLAMDKVRQKFGDEAVTFGRAARFNDSVVREDKYSV